MGVSILRSALTAIALWASSMLAVTTLAGVPVTPDLNIAALLGSVAVVAAIRNIKEEKSWE